jgi:hypothetical protein
VLKTDTWDNADAVASLQFPRLPSFCMNMTEVYEHDSQDREPVGRSLKPRMNPFSCWYVKWVRLSDPGL